MKKLIANLKDKKEYAIQKKFKTSIKLRVRCLKVHRITKFNQKVC